MTHATGPLANAAPAGEWHGAHWIRDERRLAIYLRDGLACAYCGTTIEDGAILSLDHLKPRSRGGKNDSRNLVTCCRRCNSRRGNRSVRSFCRIVAEYNGARETAAIERHVRNCARRQPDMDAARHIIAQRAEF